VYSRIQSLVLHLSGSGTSTRDMVRMIAHLNDQILLRLIALMRQDRFADLPARALPLSSSAARDAASRRCSPTRTMPLSMATNSAPTKSRRSKTFRRSWSLR
jgi:hypothetical protein